MLRRLNQIGTFLTILALLVPAILFNPEPAQAAASMYLVASPSVVVGENVNISVSVNTGGQAANAFDATFTYPTNLFEGVRGTYSGSVCTLPISPADPSGGTATISCGRPSGYNGTGSVATIVLKAISPGSGNLGLSGCTVLANDGLGTNITGGCSGGVITVTGAPTPTPGGGSPTATPVLSGQTPTPRPGTTPRPTNTPKPTATPTPGGPGAGVSTPDNPDATPPITGPDAELLPESTPLPDGAETATPEPETPQSERRSIGQAFKDIFGSLGELKSAGGNLSGIIALLLTMIPVLLLFFAIVFLGYRLYLLERRRRRTLDRLFELELAELASLEGKLDLLAEKGAKGKQQFKEEFQAVKENILRQIKPEYNKPVDAPKAKPEATEQK